MMPEVRDSDQNFFHSLVEVGEPSQINGSGVINRSWMAQSTIPGRVTLNFENPNVAMEYLNLRILRFASKNQNMKLLNGMYDWLPNKTDWLQKKTQDGSCSKRKGGGVDG